MQEVYSVSRTSRTNHSSNSFFRTKNLNFVYTLYLSHLLKFRFEIDSIEEIFHEEQIWADQIEGAIKTLGDIQNTIKNIPNLFNLKNQDKSLNGTYRYKIIVGSQYLNSQINEATELIRRLELTNRSSKKSIQKNIRHLFLLLKTNLDSLLEDLENSRQP